MKTMSYQLKSLSSRLLPLAVVLAGQLFVAREGLTEEVLIRIVGSGGTAVYLGPGQTSPAAVKVAIGDAVSWQNEGNRAHTATSFDSTGSLNFDTGAIAASSGSAPFPKSDPVTITARMFERAGGTPGNNATIDYFCDFHGPMAGKLEVREASVNAGPGDGPAPPAVAAPRVRRDITKLAPPDLNAYRDAWRRAQSTGAFQTVAGYHGCPKYFCHSDESIFFPWHREYLLRLEQQLGEPVHYWDWSAPDAASTGIPIAFTASTYVSSADGLTYANPLYATRFQCPTTSPVRSTVRNARPATLLTGYGNAVRNAYLLPDFTSFSDSINFGPHGNVHTWVNGDMRSTVNAAYDPIFWAHHSNIDRQWASWQAGGKPNPPPTTLNTRLPGFAPKTASDVLDMASLGYKYDRLDTFSVSLTGGAMQMATSSGRSGVGKTFAATFPSRVDANERVAVMGAQVAAPLQLVVGGIESHPKESLFVYVFANQPDANVEDAKQDNPRFLGSFGVFGGSGQPATHTGAQERAVMTLPADFQARLGDTVTQLTLVVVDENDAIVSREEIPFNSARLETMNLLPAAAAQVQGVQAPAGGGWKSYEGVSNRESYDEAYQNAVDKAMADLATGNTTDVLIEVQVQSVEGSRGGIAGLRVLRVKIRARL